MLREGPGRQSTSVSLNHRSALVRGVDLGGTNAMPPRHHRRPGPVAAAPLDPRLVCELVLDGHHLADDTVRPAHRLADPDRLTLVSDAMPAAGMAARLLGLRDRVNCAPDRARTWSSRTRSRVRPGCGWAARRWDERPAPGGDVKDRRGRRGGGVRAGRRRWAGRTGPVRAVGAAGTGAYNRRESPVTAETAHSPERKPAPGAPNGVPAAHRPVASFRRTCDNDQPLLRCRGSGPCTYLDRLSPDRREEDQGRWQATRTRCRRGPSWP